ncbi:hypothetical protein OC842_000379 [Tilletia horrida]|uniref:Uncharacterized protein n=1 Tax=Tilletia horrida TaxID=155126 RepID=A0AAN6GJY3_9BASI|nr:hypothetical protein OC842_000379 [Tilletia horrida]KAK0543848.1 hypothetical protein OC844_007541 [Tilletia horrida]
MAGFDAIDIGARAVGILGSGAWLGLTLSTSNCLIPMILHNKTLSRRQRIELWDTQFTLSVLRWTPIGILGALSFFFAAYRSPGAGIVAVRGGAAAEAEAEAVMYNTRLVLSLSGGALLAMIPLTVKFIFPTVFALKDELKKGEEKEMVSEEEVRALIGKWEGRHRLRIACSLVCAVLGVYDLGRIALAA